MLRLVAAQGGAHAHMTAPQASFKTGDITVETPWLRATPKGAKVAGGYMTITNHGKEADRFVGGSIEGAGRFEIHEMSMQGDVMQMRKMPDGIEIKPGATVELKPGGFHVMGLDLSRGYAAGETIKGTLKFEKAGEVAVEFRVAPLGAPGPEHAHH
jgi:copper(I)-binding protein